MTQENNQIAAQIIAWRDAHNVILVQPSEVVLARRLVAKHEAETQKKFVEWLQQGAALAEQVDGDIEVNGEVIDGDTITGEAEDAASEYAYDNGLEWDGDLAEPGFWEPSTC
ncbi:hypothetical protein FDI24_gp247 [Acidovorax phage ACP17]|uniref:Uncharacterized protein n=1 Tax=Acidovorax phage ACP17 TaxID=2010329 RepID=A0A218M3B3_9CAUD|nr:hypothetical protein FDI24_gp247 [Acidovorax phage ACP17]ASD50528.1 hypothetical protein [Acidovorax phage ACP17]